MNSSLLRVAGMLCLIAGPAAAGIYIPGDDFSTAANPNGVWQYGYTFSLGDPITLFATSGNSSGLDYWNYAPFDMGVGHNPLAIDAGTCGSCSVPAGYAFFSPGNTGAYAVFRFTAPADGTYDIDLTFQGADFSGPTSSDVDVYHNTTSLYYHFIAGFGAPSAAHFAQSEFLAAGDTLDIAVGRGNGSYGWDSTAFTGSITGGPDTPEPATYSLVGVAGLLGAVYAKRKRARG